MYLKKLSFKHSYSFRRRTMLVENIVLDMAYMFLASYYTLLAINLLVN